MSDYGQNDHRYIRRARRFVMDEDTVYLAQHGLRNVCPDVNLLDESYPTENEEYHDCEIPPGFDTPGAWAFDAIVQCVDCRSPERPLAMHGLGCGHSLCRDCLHDRSILGITNDNKDALAFEVARKLYEPSAEGHARTAPEKCLVMADLWEQMEWSCCGLRFRFRDFLSRGCIPPVIAGVLRRAWNKMIHIIEKAGDRVVLWFLEGFMVLELEGYEEVARCYHGRLDISIWNPVRRSWNMPEGYLTEDFPLLARQARLLWSQFSLPAGSFEEDPFFRRPCRYANWIGGVGLG